MRETAVLVGSGVLFTVGIVCLATFVKTAPHPPPDISIPMLLADPEYFRDREVRVKLTGVERDGANLVYRTHTNRPPALVFRLSKPISETPEFLRGVCRGKNEGVVLVDECRAE